MLNDWSARDLQGTTRGFLEDGDPASMTAGASGPEGRPVGQGEVIGRVVTAH